MDNQPPIHSKQLIESILPKIAVTYTAQDVFKRSLTWSEAKEALRKINVESALISMAMLNGLSAEFSQVDFKEQDGLQKLIPLINYLIPPDYRQSARDIYDENSRKTFVPLSAQACIAMTEACARYCSRKNGKRFEQPYQNESFALILLSFQGNLARADLFSQPYDVAQLSPEQFNSFTRGYQSANYSTDFHGAMVRHFLLFESKEMVSRLNATPAEWFEKISSISPELYRLIQILFTHLGGEFSLDNPDLTNLLFNLNIVLANVESESAKAVHHLISTTEIDFEELDATNAPKNWDEAVFSQHYLRRRPILKIDKNNYVCLHRQLILEKFFISTAHVLTELVTTHPHQGSNTNKKKRIDQLRIDLGYIFENYVSRLLLAYFPEKESKARFSYQGPSRKERDGLIIIGDMVLLFEFVHHPWSLLDRAAGSFEIYAKHLKDNIQKLSEVAEAISKHEFLKTEMPTHFQIVPIIVLSEAVPVSEMVAETFLNGLADQPGCKLLVSGSGSILPFQLLSVTQLEAIDRFIPSKKGGIAVANFLRARASTPLKRVIAEPTLGQKLRARNDRFGWAEDALDKSFEEEAPKMFKQPSIEGSS